ncbi:General transcription factor II-I repeat domain-containing protein 2 [Oopsacas minuta]|uniref:General transcription factor II-I repeat domain-containing protein 2 n=1 Tax=Oopsacas minuta TaxID=111878 RepID=A0AAV7JF76_9METZ|nr:General transcription factor II-I repeat domain-containing protein 2 [Oopsacas minuta]
MLINMTDSRLIYERKKLKVSKYLLQAQQAIFTKVNRDEEGVVRASYAVSEIIAKNLKCFTDGEFVVDCIKTVTEISCPERRTNFLNQSVPYYRTSKAR